MVVGDRFWTFQVSIRKGFLPRIHSIGSIAFVARSDEISVGHVWICVCQVSVEIIVCRMVSLELLRLSVRLVVTGCVIR